VAAVTGGYGAEKTAEGDGKVTEARNGNGERDGNAKMGMVWAQDRTGYHGSDNL
jgi:hypothetical protein